MTISNGTADLTMSLGTEYEQALGSVHGMIFFKVVDETAFYAAQSLVPDVWLTTASVHMNITGPLSSGSTVAAHAQVLHQTRSSFIVESRVTNAAGDLVAQATVTMVRTKQPLPNHP